MGNPLLVLILLIAALSAVLSGMAVFGNSRPPDSRVNTLLDDLNEIKAVLGQLQKAVLQIERKIEKESKESKSEVKDLLDKAADRLEKRMLEME